MKNFVDQVVTLVKHGHRDAAVAMINHEPDILDALNERIVDGGIAGGFEDGRYLTLDEVLDQAQAL